MYLYMYVCTLPSCEFPSDVATWTYFPLLFREQPPSCLIHWSRRTELLVNEVLPRWRWVGPDFFRLGSGSGSILWTQVFGGLEKFTK
jgi:hypothetical protein